MPRTSEPLSSSAHRGQRQKAKGETEVGAWWADGSQRTLGTFFTVLSMFFIKDFKIQCSNVLLILVFGLLKTRNVGGLHSHSTEVETEAVSQPGRETTRHCP